MPRPFLSRNWKIFLAAAFIFGALLRVLYVQDMEYKEDEQYHFTQTQLIGHSESWPWVGIPSGVYIVNPGMSVWTFAVLAKAFGIHTPTGLSMAVRIFSLLGISLLLPFALWLIPDREREPWLWSLALGFVNPFLIVYDRKLWPEGLLPFFTLLLLWGWWKREKRIGAFAWGLIGALIGQVHMSGFFFAGSLFAWTLLFDRKPRTTFRNKPIRWPFWIGGSVLGTLPLLPWVLYVLKHPVTGRVSGGWVEAQQLKYWVFWLTDSFGLHLGNVVGINHGNNQLKQLADFARYPLVSGHASYLVGAMHIALAAALVFTLFVGIRALWDRKVDIPAVLVGTSSQTAFVQTSTFIGMGLLLTLTGVWIRRYYLAVTFPFEFIFVAGLLLRSGISEASKARSRKVLGLIWAAQAVVSASFINYIHVNQGAPDGDYGLAYHLVHKPPVGYNEHP